MKKRVLVFGGTRYFGRRLVEELLADGHQITIATRGQAADSFGTRVERRIVNRSEPASLGALKGEWDLIYDNICYAPNEAASACELFKDRVGRYIHTSTQSTYLTDDDQRESDFDPRAYPVRRGERADFDYGEGKRLAEAVYAQRAPFPIVAVRIPIVLGPDDYTGRLEHHVGQVLRGEELVFPRLSAETVFISSAEAAAFLKFVGNTAFVGPINACSDGPISGLVLVDLLEKACGKRAILATEGPEENHSTFLDARSRRLDSRLAKSLGFRFSTTLDWAPALFEQTAVKLTNC